MRALAVSGGGSRGATQVGMLKHLIGDLGIEYDICCGISVGALNVIPLAMAPRGHIRDGLDRLLDIWRSIEGNGDIWEHWFIPYVPGLLWKDSFYDATPLKETIEKSVKDELVRASGRKLRIGCVKYGDGEYIDADENTPELWKWVYASAAFPAFFQPMKIGDELLMDGGARRITPLKAAIDAGADEIDVLLASRVGADIKEPTENWAGTEITGLKVAMRAIELQSAELFERDLMLCQLHNRLIENGVADQGKRYIKIRVFSPTKSFKSGSLTFDPADIALRMGHGYDVAKRVMAVEGA